MGFLAPHKCINSQKRFWFFLTQRMKPFLKGKNAAQELGHPTGITSQGKAGRMGPNPGFKVGFLHLGEEDNISEPSYFLNILLIVS